MERETRSLDPTLANRYLSGQLTDSERDAFEFALASNRAVLRELEATARLKIGLLRLRASGELDELLQEVPWHRSPTWFALAAVLACLIVGIAFWRWGLEPVGRPLLAATPSALLDEAGHPLPLSGAYVAVHTRAETFAHIELPPGRSAIELRVFPQMVTGPTGYRAYLMRFPRNVSREQAAALRDLQPDREGFVHLYVDSARLAAGRYELVLSDNANGDDRETFELDVVLPPAR
jgi:hypothetical protein